jgi:hypothetical protein
MQLHLFWMQMHDGWFAFEKTVWATLAWKGSDLAGMRMTVPNEAYDGYFGCDEYANY